MADTSPADLARDVQRTSIRENAALDLPFLGMNTLAAIIASYGLLANSPAVVIGAMIIAMLLGPISGAALALVDGDNRLLAKSLTTLLAGSAGVFVTAFILGLIHHKIPITHEILARTSPNLTDLMIALAGGAAGAYATVSTRLSGAFVGVAIATALVPPICAGMALVARGEYQLGLNAFFLAFDQHGRDPVRLFGGALAQRFPRCDAHGRIEPGLPAPAQLHQSRHSIVAGRGSDRGPAK